MCVLALYARHPMDALGSMPDPLLTPRHTVRALRAAGAEEADQTDTRHHTACIALAKSGFGKRCCHSVILLNVDVQLTCGIAPVLIRIHHLPPPFAAITEEHPLRGSGLHLVHVVVHAATAAAAAAHV